MDSEEIFISLRFDEALSAAKALRAALAAEGISAYICETKPGDNIRQIIIDKLSTCKMAIIMGSVTYGKNTASNFSTYQELFYILDEKLPFFLIKMCDRFSEADTRFQLNSGVAYFKWLPAADQQCPAVPPGLVDEIKAKLATVLAPTRSNSLNTSLASPTLTSPVTLTANSVDEATNSLASTTLQGERTAAHYERMLFSQLESEAASGAAVAEAEMAVRLRRGQDGAQRDEAASFAYAKKAADKGNARGLANLGICYERGVGVAKDRDKALSCYRQAAAEGDAVALFSLGLCCETGVGMAKDPQQAVAYYKLAGDKGHSRALNNLGLCYKYGVGVERDLTEAAAYFKLAADLGLVDAQANLGRSLKNGLGVTANLSEAVRYFRLAAVQGSAAALYELGRCYENGLGVPQDQRMAVQNFVEAATHRHSGAQFCLGLCYYQGNGVEKSEAMACRYFKLAADAGDPDAQVYLARCLATGEGLAKNEQEALRYYQLAAKQGHAMAQFYLGTYYQTQGRDPELAVYFWKKAAAQGLNEASQALKGLSLE